MEVGDLARWIPIGVDIANGTVDWCALSDVRFEEPFFDQTVHRWRAERPVVRTGIDALLELDGSPSLEPAGLIFHLSRCGSTLVTRLLQTLEDVRVVVEPAPLNAVLRPASAAVDEAVRVRLIRLIVRALGRIGARGERMLVLKLSSWNIRRAAVIRAAFPGVACVWLQRSPAEVLASLRARPPGWAGNGAAIADIFGSIDGDVIAGAVATMLVSAREQRFDRIVDYRDLPGAVWETVAPLCGIRASEIDIDRMQGQARFSAKSIAPVRFHAVADGAASLELPAGMLADYAALDRFGRACSS